MNRRMTSTLPAPAQAVYLYGSTMLRPLRLAYGLAPVIAILDKHGHALEPLLSAAKIPRFALEEPGYRIRFEQELAFIRSTLRRLRLPAAGLEVGQQFNLALFGVLGLAAACAPNVREVFRTVPSFRPCAGTVSNRPHGAPAKTSMSPSTKTNGSVIARRFPSNATSP